MSSTFIWERRPPVRAMERTLESARSSRASAVRAAPEGSIAASTNPIAMASIRLRKDTESAKAGATRCRAFARRSAFLYMKTLRMSFSNMLLNILFSRTKSSECTPFPFWCVCRISVPCPISSCLISYRTVYPCTHGLQPAHDRSHAVPVCARRGGAGKVSGRPTVQAERSFCDLYIRAVFPL